MNRMSEPDLILASASPRRSALLRQIGVAHRIAAPEIAEVREPRENLEACIRRLALSKARQVRERERASKLPVLGADTAVVLGDEMLGKPADREAALAMLARLEGRSHRVLTAVALVGKHGETLRLARSTVTFRRIDADEIERYWDSGEPVDKAGAYGIQGIAAVFVEKIEGSYSGVMGLPLYETAALLDAAGVPRWLPVALPPGPA